MLTLFTPVRAIGEERFFLQPTTDTQPPTQPGFTAIDTAGSPEGYIIEGVVGLSHRIEIGLDYENTPTHQLVVVGRIRLLDEQRETPAVAVGVDKSEITSFGIASGPSPNEFYAEATKTIGSVRVMTGAYRFAQDFGEANNARDNVGPIAAAELDLGNAGHGVPGRSLGPPALDLVADFAGGSNPFGQFGFGVGFHSNVHLNIQPSFVVPTNHRYGPAHFQLQVHVN